MTTALEGVSFLSGPQSEPTITEPGANTQLGKDAFLKLLVAQMQNQDPLNPQSNEEFVAQLSQFTQVEQLMDLSTQFDGMYMAMNSVNNTSMTQLLGKEVVAVGNQFFHSGEDVVKLHYAAAGSTQGSKLTVYNEAGSVVYSGPLGSLKEGEGFVEWDGRGVDGQPLPEGNYTFSISGFDGNGDTVEIQELMVGIVDGMSYETGVPTPSINDVIFDLGQILRVEIAENE